MKNLFVFISITLLTGCNTIVDPKNQCSSFKIDINFYHSNSNLDVTGDSINLPYIRYDKDSIRYIVFHGNENTDTLMPVIISGNGGEANTYSIAYRFGYNPGIYNIVLLFNSSEKDTIVADVPTDDNLGISFSYKNKNIGSLNDQCYSRFIINK